MKKLSSPRLAPMAVIAAAVALTAVSAPAAFAAAPAKPAPAKAAGGGLIEQQGFRIAGTSRTVAFGEPEAGVIAFVTGVWGAAPSRTTATNCRNGVFNYADWGKGLKLVFKEGKLIGWVADPRLGATYSNSLGIDFKATVGALQAKHGGFMLMDAVKGKEFAYASLWGRVLKPGPAATIDLLWAGSDCKPK